MRRFGVIVVAAFSLLVSGTASEAQTINQKIVTFLNGKVGTRIGGGECAHVATEALRVAGAEFTKTDLGADFPATGDCVWGTLVKSVSVTNGIRTDSAPTALVQPGDIIQYYTAQFVYSTYSNTFSRHTSVVSLVNASGMPTEVFQENFGGVRTLTKAVIDLTKLKTGWVRIYRPKPRVVRTGQFKITIVNNVTTTQSATIKVGTSTISTFSLGAANTASSYSTRWFTTSSTTAPTIVLPNGQTATITNAGGYELYSGTGGVVMVRKLAQ
jgi:hypothetical protein